LHLLQSICQEPNIFIANAFSPDNDGYNDQIYVQGAGITALYFVIYNRWGEQLFETNRLQEGWDGFYKGMACPPDVYGYYVECRCLDGNRFFKKGNITLLK
jgi:gliding motility-associated-like protein